MGFYTHKPGDTAEKIPVGKSTARRWTAVVALSAMLGSGATLAAISTLPRDNALPIVSSVDHTPADEPVASTVYAGIGGGITDAVKLAEPTVMGVVNYAQVSDFFNQNTKLEPSGVGTGVLIDKDGHYGYAATNNHVVEGAAKVEVVMESGKHIHADVVGTDAYTDLAVLKIPLEAVKSITPAEFADSDNILVGEPAIAIGTPLGLDFADSVTAGIVSAKRRIMPVEEPQTHQTLDYQAVIQTDAAINPGNSGGPLLNIHGQVIGINSSKIVAQNFEGMGFAIPSNEVKSIADQIMKTGHAEHPALGITGQSLSSIPEQWWPNVPVDYGVWIQSVTSTDVKKAGLQQQDVIVAIDGKSIRNMADLRTYLFEKKPGDDVTITFYRDSKKTQLKMKLGQMQTSNTAHQPQDGSGSPSEPLDPFSVPSHNGY
jgi:serine protease Do